VGYLVTVGALDDEFGQGGSFEKINYMYGRQGKWISIWSRNIEGLEG
jgi:hypothetical protein